MSDQTLRTALYDKHIALEARMGTEANWDMPLSYGGALEEAATARKEAAIFDVSHFGRIRLRGDDSLDLLDRVCANDAASQEDDTASPALMCNAKGGVIDLVRLVRLSDYWLVLTSPTCRTKVLEHLQANGEGMDVKIDDQTEKTTMVAMIGPRAPSRLAAVLPLPVAELKSGDVMAGSFMIARYVAIRSSLAGLYCLEVVLPNMLASQAWRFITDKAGENRIAPAGLAAWDILRVEAGLPRYGHEINETINPYQAALGALVRPDGDFIGAEALRKFASGPARRWLAGLVLSPPAAVAAPPIAPQGSAVLGGGAEVGTTTSGAFSPAMDASIAMAYVSPDACKPGADVEVVINGESIPANVVNLPFVSS